MTDSTKSDANKPSNSSSPKGRRDWIGWLVLGITTLGVLALALLFASIQERRGEARIRRPMVPIAPLQADSSKWAANWPREYSSLIETRDDTTRTKHGGAFPRDLLEETPANVILFAGYGFAKQYRQAQGHEYTIEDVVGTQRVNDKTPATCWTCKSPDVPRTMVELALAKRTAPGDAAKAADIDINAEFQSLVLEGAGDFYAKSFQELKPEITHPIGCLDCHEPETMRLRLSRPALIETLQRQGRNIDEISHQEMRSLVCAQCHVEYYFKGPGKHLTFPWQTKVASAETTAPSEAATDDVAETIFPTKHAGTTVEDMAEYYKETGHVDWTHAISKTPMVKMQHPDFEVYSTGIHAYRDVSCADCHMPYRTEGTSKFTDHHIQSPLLNISNSCAVCHRWSEEETRARVESIQDKVAQGRHRAENALTLAHLDIAACMEAGATDDELKDVRDQVRQAQLRWDYVAANNGLGFHSPQECMRILAAAVDLAQECRIDCARILAMKGYTQPVNYPSFATKETAQSLIQQFIDGQPPKLLSGDAN